MWWPRCFCPVGWMPEKMRVMCAATVANAGRDFAPMRIGRMRPRMAAPPQTRSPPSCRSTPAEQQPEWPDADHARDVREQLLGMPPLVFAGGARQLQAALAAAAAGRRVL